VKTRRLAAALAGLGVLIPAVVGCGVHHSTGLPRAPQAPTVPQQVPGYLDARTRIAKARLIQQLKAPPDVVIFGGSRVLRCDPAYIHQRTGLTAFNAAVTHARPEDTWALLNLLHTRFPQARFRFLWVIHGDEFVARHLDAALLLDQALARYFPSSLIKEQLPLAVLRGQGAVERTQLAIQGRGRLVYAPDGYVVSGFFSSGTPPPEGHPGGIAANIRRELRIYRASPVALGRRSVMYFVKDLRLMDSLAARRPVIVAAPFDRRIYAATVHRGWGARHHRILELLGQLRSTLRFSFLDLSRATAHGFTPREFYDGIHLTPQGAQRVVDLVLRRFPHAF
jgi:hypothetical protein